MDIKFFIDVIRNIAVIMVMAYVIFQLKAFRQSLSDSSYRLTDKLVLILFFGALSAIGNVLSIPVIGGALANHRIVGAVTGGLLGGPAVGLGAGILGAAPRYFMGGFTMWSAVISNIIAGLLSGLVCKYCGPKRFEMRVAFATALASEAVLKLLVLTIADPWDKAVELERIIALPTILTNCLAVCLFTYLVRDMLRQKEKDREQGMLLSRAELNVLRAQINPHFLFNALGTIRWMAGKDPEATRALIKDLSDFLRRTLYRGREIVSLQDELDAIAAYIRIEKARFADKIAIRVQVPEQLLHCPIPVFTLQPLVENSIKHGLSPKKEPGVIHISAWEEGQNLYVEIQDDGVGMAQPAAVLQGKPQGPESGSGGIGIGMQNVHKRLQIYGDQYGLTIRSRPGCTSVTVRFPRSH